MHKSTINTAGSAGSGTVTEVDTGTGLTGGPITASGTISVATGTANSLAGYNNSGVFSGVTVGSGLSLSSGTLTATGGASAAFNAITSGTNTTAAMVVGTGASLSATGSGTIAATTTATNANLTGVITSVGNATSIASQTGTGTKFVVDTSPTLVTPVLGVATATSINTVALSGSATPALAVTGTSSVSGSNTGDQTISLTSDVTGSGTGSFATTIRSSVALAGSPTTTTQAASDNSTKIATTAYVTTGISNAIAGVNPATAVQAATTQASDTSSLTYNNGVGGIGATLTGANNTAITWDGFTFTALGQRGLIKNDTQSPSGAFNGVYYITQVQTAILPPILTRALDYDQPSDINNTGAIPVVNGTLNALTSWLLTSAVTTVGTDPLTYTKFSINPTTQLTNTLTSAHLLVGNVSNVATDVAVSGDLTLANTGAFTIAKIAGVAVGTPTGTTNVVFSNSPTLVSPALGTPASGVATNLTGTASGLTAGHLSNNIKSIGFTATTPVTGKQAGYITFPLAGTITGWSISVDTGTATITTWKIAAGTAVPTVSNSISTSGVAISSGTSIRSTTTSDFTSTTVTAADIFAFNISAVSGATQITFLLEVTVT